MYGHLNVWSPEPCEIEASRRGRQRRHRPLGEEVIEHYLHTARWEQFKYGRRITDWELKRGFDRY